MQIKLKTLSLLNFKGIKNMTVEFGETTSIFGDNATGKTSLFDAFCWLLFGKDSLDRKNFQVKTLDKNNQAISKLEHSVKGVIFHNGIEISLQRIFKEKWVKKRGETISEFTGHESLFFINEAPAQAGEFQNFISSLIPENIFKMVTSPYYFNSMKWEDRRNAIIQMAGDVSDNEVANGIEEFEALLSTGKNLEQYKKEVSGKRKLLNDSLKLIPTRIDEIHRGIPERESVTEIEARKTAIESRLKEIESSIESVQQAYKKEFDEVTRKQQDIHLMKRKLSDIEFAEKNKLTEGNQQRDRDIQAQSNAVERLQQAIKDLDQDIRTQQLRITKLNSDKQELVKKWEARNSEALTFSEHEFNCPTCLQMLPEKDRATRKETLTKTFNEKKVKDLAAITAEGTELKRAVESAENNVHAAEKTLATHRHDLATAQRELEELKESVPPTESVSLDFVLAKNTEYIQLNEEIKKLDAEITKPVEPDFSALKLEKSTLSQELDELKSKITVQQQREKSLTRITELEKEERDLAQQIADLEKTEFTIDGFNKAKMSAIEQRINSNFKYVTFKMYNQLINGGEEPTCETLINGVPFTDANHAAQINAGIDIVNAFSRHYDIIAPVFIDNAEAITRLIESPSQIIRLVVSQPDKKLRVEREMAQVAA